MTPSSVGLLCTVAFGSIGLHPVRMASLVQRSRPRSLSWACGLRVVRPATQARLCSPGLGSALLGHPRK